MSETPEEPVGPRRVIGTPSPAPTAVDVAPEPSGPAFSAEPPAPGHAKNAERVAAALFVLAFLAGCGFIAAFIGLEVGQATLPAGANTVDAVLRSNLALGTSLSVALLALGAGSIIWVRHLTPDIEIAEQRHDLQSAPADRAAFKQDFAEGAAISQVTRRPLLRRTMLLATAPLALAPLVLLRDLGPLPQTDLRHTVWRKGLRAVTLGGLRPLRPADMTTPGSMITVIPQGFQDDDDALAKAGVILIKFAPGELHVPTTHHILCPCHQSTFDAANGANVIFGPAARALPQLPLMLDSEGYLAAASDFTQPVGPSFWERG
jgi:quinol---cytochrome c reductase iron-sulfur subunit